MEEDVWIGISEIWIVGIYILWGKNFNLYNGQDDENDKNIFLRILEIFRLIR